MKNLMKRLATVALTGVMALGFVVPAFAGNGGDRKLTVTGDTLDDKDVFAVQMFTATAQGTDSVSFTDYELADEWLTFFTTSEDTGGLGLGASVTADDARVYVEKLTDENLVNFADKAQAWVRSHPGVFSVITSDTEDPAVADKATFTGLLAGYYLVYPEGGFTGNSRGTDAMLVNVPQDRNAEWDIKSTYPTVGKKVDTDNNGPGEATNNGSAQVGKTVTFTLDSNVPDMSDYQTYYFGFVDTLTKGLKVVNDNDEIITGDKITTKDVEVMIGGTSVTSGYTVSLKGNELRVEFENLMVVTGAKTGAKIVVTYKAVITKDAITTDGTGTASNTVKVVYSNDPTTDTKGESTPDESKVYTYDIDVNKWAQDGEHRIENLAGAVFILSTSKEAPTNEQIEANYAGYNGLIKLVGSGNSYQVAEVDEQETVNSFKTIDSGDINIAGLGKGTYYLHEVAAPDGYNKLKDPVTVVINVTNYEDGTATITVNGGAATNGNVVDVENKKGIELPETGSIGTIGLTALGVLVIAVGVLAPRRKKSHQE